MFQQQYANEETLKADRARPLFGPPQPEEVQVLAWDWRRELSRGLLLVIEGVGLLAWALFFIRLNAPLSTFATQALVSGWFALALLALGAGHLVIRLEERVGWGRTRLFLSGLIIVSTTLWWVLVSGGWRAFLSDIGNVFHLQPGPGFWTLWLAIIAWMRGMEWSQKLVGLYRARATMHSGLLLLAVLALLGQQSSALLPALVVLWVLGLIALGLARLVAEDWALAVVRSGGFMVRQGTFLAGAALTTLSGGLFAHWLLEPSRREAMRQWLWSYGEAPAGQLGMILLHLAIIFLAIVWRIIYWIAVEFTAMVGITFTPSPQYQP
ncbi:MAG: hypothetical protein H0T73_21340, partial [Ardenticatenales bacterium]|nr:hypothetical protein [Ardenticatenales bacterium]